MLILLIFMMIGIIATWALAQSVWGDYDNDGFPDLFMTRYGRNVLYHNNGNRTFTDVTDKAGIAGTESGAFHSGATFFDLRSRWTKSNRDAMGARIRVVASGLSQIREIAGGGSYLSQSDLRTNFGLGKTSRVESVEVTWPSGHRQLFRNVEADKFYLIEEG
jgi:hypothetical protein